MVVSWNVYQDLNNIPLFWKCGDIDIFTNLQSNVVANLVNNGVHWFAPYLIAPHRNAPIFNRGMICHSVKHWLAPLLFVVSIEKLGDFQAGNSMGVK